MAWGYIFMQTKNFMQEIGNLINVMDKESISSKMMTYMKENCKKDLNMEMEYTTLQPEMYIKEGTWEMLCRAMESCNMLMEKNMRDNGSTIKNVEMVNINSKMETYLMVYSLKVKD